MSGARVILASAAIGEACLEALTELLDVRFELGERADAPTFSVDADSVLSDRDSLVVEFTAEAEPPLRNARLPHLAFVTRLVPSRGERVLANADGRPVWTRSAAGDRVATGFEEMRDRPLRECVSLGRFLPILPLIDFVRRVAPTWTRPPLRAAFLFDDPNLHAMSYGYLDYRAVVRANIHAAVAMIPLDAWYASRDAVALFRERSDALSIVCHGNDHLRRELARDEERAAVTRRLVQAVRRIRRFEERYGVHVQRVMAPPHGVCSQVAAEELLAAGFEALCVSRPYPWLSAPPVDRPLAGLQPAEVVVGGLPVIPRLHLGQPHDELVLRAFLGQPVILYGHHEDVSSGTDVLLDAAADVARLGPAQWSSLEDICRSNYESRVVGDQLRLRLHTRRAQVRIPEGVQTICVETGIGFSESLRVRMRSAATILEQEVVDGQARFTPGVTPAVVELEVLLDEALEPPASPGLPHPWPWIRRAVTEGRDRGRVRIGR
jgi:hypothetical protein